MNTILGSRDVLIDNTLLTAATRALNDGPNCSDFDFFSLVELSQSLICYDNLVLDGSSRTVAEDKESWDRATSPWGKLQSDAIRSVSDFSGLEIRERALDEAARVALQETSTGAYTEVYQEACVSVGVQDLLPRFYRSDSGGPDDNRFTRAKKFLSDNGTNLAEIEKHKDAIALARYVFRGFYYYQVAVSLGVNYAPCALRAKLLAASNLAVSPKGELASKLSAEAARFKDYTNYQELIEFLSAAGLRLSYDIRLTPTSFSNLNIPFMFLYILNICEKCPGMSIPEAISTLRRKEEVVRFRENVHEILANIRSEAMTLETREALLKNLDENNGLLQNAKYAQGVQTARLPLLPYLETGAQTAKPLSAFLKTLPKSTQKLLTLRIPPWMFKEHLLSDRLVILWQLFEQRAALRNARDLFNEHWTKYGAP